MARGRGGRRGRSGSTVSAPTDAARGTQSCGTCDGDVGDEAIGCDECETWVHNTEMCSGLTQDMIGTISRYQGSGIKFVCMKCRVTYTAARGNSPSSSTEPHMAELVGQLFQQVKGISNIVQELVTQVKALSIQNKPNQLTSAPPPNPTYASALSATTGLLNAAPSTEYRTLVREELRELEEQRKRRDSLVIRGLEANSAQAAVKNFEAVSEHLIQHKVTLEDVVRIPSETDLYRGKIKDDNTRKLILDKAKNLKGSAQFGSVFIRRDLTYNQRRELRARRALTDSNSAARVNSQTQGLAGHSERPEAHPRVVQGGPTQLMDTIPKRPMNSNTPGVSND